MLKFQQHQDRLQHRLYVIGIPSCYHTDFISTITRWETCSGVEWTIKRLKGLKVDLIRRQSKLPHLSFIRLNRKGDIYGVIGSLFRWADKSEKNFSKTIQAFMAYSFYILPSLTESQKEKFLSGINPSEVSDGLDDMFHIDFSRSVTAFIGKCRVRHSVDPYVCYTGSPSKKAPRLFGRSSVPQNEKILDDLQFLSTCGGRVLYRKYKDLYDPLLKGLKHRRQSMVPNQDIHRTLQSEQPIGGQIHFLQEPGGKLRSIASPLRIHQHVLKPLGNSIYGIVRHLPWDCTFDQSKAIPFIQSHLEKDGVVHSIDLSSATDHFPLSLQESALRAIFFKSDWKHIDLFIEISRGIWDSPIGELQWTKGQPLGLYPSFASFTLTHGFLLYYLNGNRHDDQFFVVGDDVVILNDELRIKYVNILERMKCPWSPDKSISSNKLSEFAGKVITPSKVIPQMKWRNMSNDNFLDICKLLGHRSRCLLSSRQKRVFDKVSHLCDPVGLSLNSKGLPLEERIFNTLDFYQPEKRVLGSLLSLSKKFNSLNYSSKEPLDALELQEISFTLEQKVRSVFEQTIFKRFSTIVKMGLDGLDSIPEALEITPRLPLKVFIPNRISTLERYERM